MDSALYAIGIDHDLGDLPVVGVAGSGDRARTRFGIQSIKNFQGMNPPAGGKQAHPPIREEAASLRLLGPEKQLAGAILDPDTQRECWKFLWMEHCREGVTGSRCLGSASSDRALSQTAPRVRRGRTHESAIVYPQALRIFTSGLGFFSRCRLVSLENFAFARDLSSRKLVAERHISA